ncbi:MAG: hypothetical protein JEY91_18650 [Spirochaetaceae bacterium]|nr:hypothetical protein [Spirochaetaceae bacterium]
MINKLKFITLVVLLLPYLSAAAEESGNFQFSGTYKHSYSKTLDHKNELLFQGYYYLTNDLTLSSGYSNSINSIGENFYFSLQIDNHPRLLRYGLSFLSRDFSDYGIRENSVLPTIALMTGLFEIELGLNFRILETDVQTGTIHPLYRIQFNILDRNRWGLTLGLGNFGAFKAGNITDIHYILTNRITLNEKIQIITVIGLHNAGQIALASYYSAFFGQIGMRYNI